MPLKIACVLGDSSSNLYLRMFTMVKLMVILIHAYQDPVSYITNWCESGSKPHHVKFAQVFLDIFLCLSGVIKLLSLIDIMTNACLIL